MRLVLDENSAAYSIKAHASGEVRVGEQRLTRPFLISPTTLVTDWPAERLSTLDQASLEAILELKPRIVLIGIDAAAAPTAPRLLRQWAERQAIAMDVMNLGAACRTYTVLASENREVVAALLLRE